MRGAHLARSSAVGDVLSSACPGSTDGIYLAKPHLPEGGKILKGKRKTAGDIDEYIAGFPADVRKILEKIRTTIRKAAPDAEEKISYSMPAFAQDGILVYFAAFKKHIGLFPPVKGDRELMNAVAPYAGPKGNLQFPLNAPIPYGLIGKIVRLRVKEKLERVRK
jgi:uncharacterized protein YdhG (YjbR/CyaY superfamily)